MRNSIIATLVSFFRLPNLVLIGLFMWMVRLYLLHPEFVLQNRTFHLSNTHFWLLVIDVQLVTLLGFWLNDWFDQKIDAINKPGRFLVKYSVSPQFFFTWISIIVGIAAAISVFLAITTNHVSHLWILPVSIALLIAYAWKFKKIKVLGNLIVSFMILAILALVFISENVGRSDLLYVFDPPFYMKVLSYSILIFVLNYARELVKDLEDAEGDRLGKVNSLPIIIGVQKTQYVAICAVILTVLAQGLFTYTVSSTSGFLIGGFILGTLFITILRLHKAVKTEDFHNISQLIKLIMLLGILQIGVTQIV